MKVLQGKNSDLQKKNKDLELQLKEKDKELERITKALGDEGDVEEVEIEEAETMNKETSENKCNACGNSFINSKHTEKT